MASFVLLTASWRSGRGQFGEDSLDILAMELLLPQPELDVPEMRGRSILTARMNALELQEVSSHVLCVRRPRYFSNSYIVHDSFGVVLVDAGMDPNGSDMLVGLRSIGRRVNDVTAIILTHWHNDHSAGAEELRRQSNAKVYYGQEEHANFTRTAVRGLRMRIADHLSENGMGAALKAVIGQAPPRAVHGGTPAFDGQRLENRFLVVRTPGHTAGHLSFFYDPIVYFSLAMRWPYVVVGCGSCRAF